MRGHAEPGGSLRGAEPLDVTQPLTVSWITLDGDQNIFPGDAKHPPLCQSEAVAVLPWQIAGSKFLIAVYAMTYDVTRPDTQSRLPAINSRAFRVIRSFHASMRRRASRSPASLRPRSRAWPRSR